MIEELACGHTAGNLPEALHTFAHRLGSQSVPPSGIS